MSEDFDDAFYEQIEPFSDFTRVTELELYQFLPDDWIVGVADVVDSTGAIKAGLYKTINTIGASIIAAQFNIPGKHSFPYVFGGDGAASEVETENDSTEATSITIVAGKRRWESTFEINLADTWTVDAGGRLIVEDSLITTGTLVLTGDCRIF